jgi:hypothetical protein
MAFFALKTRRVVGDPAEQHLAQPGMAVAAHHHEVDLEPLGLFNERSRDVVRAIADAMQPRMDSNALGIEPQGKQRREQEEQCMDIFAIGEILSIHHRRHDQGAYDHIFILVEECGLMVYLFNRPSRKEKYPGLTLFICIVS